VLNVGDSPARWQTQCCTGGRAEGVARWRAWLFWAGVRIGGARHFTKTPTRSGFSSSGDRKGKAPRLALRGFQLPRRGVQACEESCQRASKSKTPKFRGLRGFYFLLSGCGLGGLGRHNIRADTMNHYDHRLQISAIQPAMSGLLFAWRKVMIATEKDRDILVRPLWGIIAAKAWPVRSPSPGRSVVAWTTAMPSPGAGGGYAGVCQKPNPFSCQNKNDPNFAYLAVTPVQ